MAEKWQDMEVNLLGPDFREASERLRISKTGIDDDAAARRSVSKSHPPLKKLLLPAFHWPKWLEMA